MRSKLASTYAVASLSGFAGGLIGIFVPVYLISLGHSVRTVMEFCLLQALLGFVAILGTSWASHRFKLKYIMMARVPVVILVLLLLAVSKTHAVPLALIAGLEGLQFVLYYLPLHVFVTNGSDEQSIGGQLGLLSAIPQIFSLGAPVLAGYIAEVQGFNLVFVLASGVYILSALAMLKLPDLKTGFSLDIAGFQTLYTRYRTYFWLEIVENIQEELDLVIWPLVVYLTLHSTLQTGLTSTIISVASAGFTYLIGRQADKSDKFWLLRLGGLGMLLLWLWRLTGLSATEIFIISTLVGFCTVLINIPFNAIIYNLARTNDPRHFIIFREIPVGLARTLVYTVGVLVASDIKHLFWFAIAAYAIFLFIPRFTTAPPHPSPV